MLPLICSLLQLSKARIREVGLELRNAPSGGRPRSLQLPARTAWIDAAAQKSARLTPAHLQKAIDQVPYAPGRPIRELPS